MRDLLAGAAPEVTWLLDVLRRRYGGRSLPEPQDLDWSVVLETARQNAIVPLIAGSPDVAVPGDVRHELQLEGHQTRLENLGQTKTLLQVLDVLKRGGIRALPYKGPVLAQVAYGDLGLRRFVDLDVLVDRVAVSRALAVLRDAGFDGSMSLGRRRLATLLKSGHDWAVHNDDGDVVELQWAVASRAHARARGVERLIDRADTVQLGGSEVPTLDPTDQVVVLAIHGSIHLWTRLSWVCDIAQAMMLPGVDAASAASIARGIGASRSLLLGVALVDRLLETAPLEELAEEARADGVIQDLVDTLSAPLLSVGGPDLGLASGRVRARVRLADRPLEGWRNAARALLTPTPADWAAVPLPDGLEALYYPIRAARLAAFAMSPHAGEVFDAH